MGKLERINVKQVYIEILKRWFLPITTAHIQYISDGLDQQESIKPTPKYMSVQ